LLYLVVTGRVTNALICGGLCSLICRNTKSLVGILSMCPGSGPTFIKGGDELPDEQSRPLIHLLHPHALFTEGITMYAMTQLANPNHRKTVVLLDRFLYHFSPLGMVLIAMSGPFEPSPLSHLRIKSLLLQGRSVVVCPGGFMETADFSRTHETIYLHMYTYWMRMAREYSCDLYSTIGYNLAGRYFKQSSYFQNLRLSLARRGLPGIFPTAIVNTPPESPTYIYSHRIRPESDTLSMIRDSMRHTIDTHERIHGASIKYNIQITTS
jgi:hypothetical protein